MKNLVLISIVLLSFKVNAQSSKLDLNFCNNMRMIEVSTSNIVNLIQFSYSEFYQSMAANNYKENDEMGEGCYLNDNGPAGSPYYVICKKPGEVSMMWTKKPCNMINQIKDELEQNFYKSIDGFSIYRISSNNINYTITLQIIGDRGSLNIARH